MTQIARCALFVGAHPDDIEFMMAGTLLLLKDAGFEVHMWNLADGRYGSERENPSILAKRRLMEAEASARIAGAHFHPPIAQDLSIFYNAELLKKACAVVRKAKPGMIFCPAPDDYMEDHTNTARLVVGAAFARGIGGFKSDPPETAWNGNLAIYHALPFGLRDPLRRVPKPDLFVDITSVIEKKKEMLECHKSQKEWLFSSQGLGSYVGFMVEMSREVGKMSGKFEFAEGFRLRLFRGYSTSEINPLLWAISEYCIEV